jgi:hypothetical protein
MIELTAQEREKFALWCECRARSSAPIIEQLSQLTIGENQLVRQYKFEVAACQFLARLLRETESQTI